MITIDSTGRTFHLRNDHFSYAMHLFDGMFLSHLYWGPPIADVRPEELMHPATVPYLSVIPRRGDVATPFFPMAQGGLSLDTLPQEYPAWGAGEYREGALGVLFADGTEALRLEYVEHECTRGSVAPDALPMTRGDHRLGDAETLRLRLADPRGGLAVDLFYVIHASSAALIRWTRVVNTGSAGAITLRDPASASLDLPADRYDMVTLAGSWARERHVVRRPLAPGRHSLGGRGGMSSHQASPFVAVCDPETDEHGGRVFAMALAYSGNCTVACDVDQYEACRLSVGINRLRAHLEPGESLDTPAAFLVQSDRGFNGMSGAFHHLLREGIVSSRWRDEARRTIINSWEAMYFDVTAEKIAALARSGKEIGAELLVLDDGWFADRRDDTTSLGDWRTNRERFPEGLRPVAEAVRREGLEFGIWIEPEMVSPESDMYRAHPDWILSVDGRAPTLARGQLTLDLANPAVVDHLFETVGAVLKGSGARYVKWDMNRAMTEAGSSALPVDRQGEVMHRYMLGLYRLLAQLADAFPDVLIEGCSGGGGRFDLGLARYCPRFWTSDQTDAVERLDIQYGTTLVFPPEMAGAHVSSVPNHQVGRITPAWTRVCTALAFSYGYELDPSRESAEDREVFVRGSQLYTAIREKVMRGRFVRLGSPSGAGGAATPVGAGFPRPAITGEGGGARAWMVESADGGEIFVFHVLPLGRANHDPGHLRLTGLSVDGLYRETHSGQVYDAAQLRHRGLWIHLAPGDYQARFWHLVRVEGGAPSPA